LARTEAEREGFEMQLARLEAAFSGIPPSENEAFSTYANLKFGMENRRQVAEWSRWLIATLKA